MSQFQQNRFFRNNEGWFYWQINGGKKGDEIVIPDAQEAKTFWTDIWGRSYEIYDWEKQTGMITDFTGESEEDIKENPELEGPWADGSG